jgi:hypothetical protein
MVTHPSAKKRDFLTSDNMQIGLRMLFGVALGTLVASGLGYALVEFFLRQ